MEAIFSLFSFGTFQIQLIMVLLIIDVVLGIIAALVKRDFRLGKLGGFTGKPVIGYIFGFGILKTVTQTLPSFILVVKIAFVLIILALIGSILNNLGKIGIPLPAVLKKE